MKRALPAFIISPSFKTRGYTEKEKTAIISYMKSKGELCAAGGGYVDDVVQGIETRIESGGYRDDLFQWSTQEIYHIEKYNAAVTDEFLANVMQRMLLTGSEKETL